MRTATIWERALLATFAAKFRRGTAELVSLFSGLRSRNVSPVAGSGLQSRASKYSDDLVPRVSRRDPRNPVWSVRKMSAAGSLASRRPNERVEEPTI